MSISQIATTLQALATPTIGAIVAYIAYQQWKTNQRREDRESRTARLSVYRRVKAMLRHIDETREVRSDLYDQFCEASAEADFLFPEAVRNWLLNVEGRASQWLTYKQDLDSTIGRPRDAHIERLESDMEKVIDELQDSHCQLLDIFSRHMH